MNVTVGTTEVELDTSAYPDLAESGQALIIQNLGAGDLYFDFVPGVTTARGIRVSPNAGYEVPGWKPGTSIYLIASTADNDVRYAVAG